MQTHNNNNPVECHKHGIMQIEIEKPDHKHTTIEYTCPDCDIRVTTIERKIKNEM